jgi:hypothetical protein
MMLGCRAIILPGEVLDLEEQFIEPVLKRLQLLLQLLIAMERLAKLLLEHSYLPEEFLVQLALFLVLLP